MQTRSDQSRLNEQKHRAWQLNLQTHSRVSEGQPGNKTLQPWLEKKQLKTSQTHSLVTEPDT